MLGAKGKDGQPDNVRDIILQGVESIYTSQAEQLGLTQAVLSAERAVTIDPFAVFLAENFDELRTWCDSGSR